MSFRSYKRKLLPWIYVNFTKHANSKEFAVDNSNLCTVVYHLLNNFVNCPITNREFILKTHGFNVGIKRSHLHNNGVFITKGYALPGSIVAIYPGTVYHPGDSILFQSVSNSYVFRCSDGVFIDGKHNGISGLFYKSISGKNQLGPYQSSDQSWLSLKNLHNPLACGQIVNNGGSENANVCYCEIDIDLQMVPLKQRKFIPNISHSGPSSWLRMVVLVARSNITEGEEVLSSYFSIC